MEKQPKSKPKMKTPITYYGGKQGMLSRQSPKRIRKYNLITSHTARRTANMYLAGIAAARIMLFTGHQTEQAFFRYIRIGREENAELLEKHEFFRG